MMNVFLLWGPPFMTGDVPKMVQFGPKTAKHDRLVNVPKWFKRVQKRPKLSLTIWEPLGTIWALLDHFKQKLNFCSKAPSPDPTLSFLGQKIVREKRNKKHDNDDVEYDGGTFQYHLHHPTLYRFPMSRPPILPSEWRCNRNHLHHGFHKYHLYHHHTLVILMWW